MTGGMTFPRGVPGPPDPQAVPTIPAELLAWGAGVRTDLAAICATLAAIRELLETQQAQRHIEFTVQQEHRELLLKIAANTGASALLARANREDTYSVADIIAVNPDST
jgi:hypothetical protein